MNNDELLRPLSVNILSYLFYDLKIKWNIYLLSAPFYLN